MTASLAARTLGQPDRALVDRAASGDHEAFDRLLGPRFGSAFHLALAILRIEDDARDAVQDAFVSAWQELPRLRDRDQFDAWLGRILVNRCRSVLRHRKVVKLRELPLETRDGPERDSRDGGGPPSRREPGVEGGQANVAEADAVRRAFDRLDPDARVLIVLHHVEERPVAEIAALAGIPEGTVKWRLHAARKALERALERERR
jgi:RNA polymerase sigma-70 factor (ECF subfamily)